jgi:hypothetical protein
MSKEDVNKSRYGVEISRLRVAEGLAKKGLGSTRGVADSVVSDLKVSWRAPASICGRTDAAGSAERGKGSFGASGQGERPDLCLSCPAS